MLADDLRDNYNELIDLKNTIDVELNESGYISPTGQESSNIDYGRTKFILFSSTDKFYLYAFKNVTALAYAFYSDAKTSAFISGAGNLNGNLSSDDITIPSNTKYIRFSTNLTQSPNAKVIVNNITEIQSEITEVQSEITEVQSEIARIQSVLKVNYSIVGYIGSDGALRNNEDYKTTDFISCDSRTVISLTGIFTGESSLAYAFYSDKNESSFISGQNNVQLNTLVTSIPSGTKYIRLCSRISHGEIPISIVANYHGALEKIDALSNEIDGKLSEVTPKNTTFFEGINYFDSSKATLYTDRFVNGSGVVAIASGNVNTLVFPVKPNTTYYFYAPNMNRAYAVENESDIFTIGQTYTSVITITTTLPAEFTTSSTAKYICFYFYSGIYDYDANKNNIILNIGKYYGNIVPFIDNKYLPLEVRNPLYNKQILIFGDSITDTCNFTINSSDETTAVTWKNPSNRYVNAGGTTIYYSMWPKMLRDLGVCAEVRNYARSGASYKDANRAAGEERQNLSYQITVALNDLNNPNNVFSIDNFNPDIVIFALGTNDGTPNDTYADAMAKTVLESDGYSINTNATLAALDKSKFCEAARHAFLRTRIAFPSAQFYCVLPIQRANNETNGGTLNNNLRQIAERYGCIIVNAFAESGIIRDINVWNTLGATLKDGLHPNDIGQNMLFRAIYAALQSHYIVTETMNP